MPYQFSLLFKLGFILRLMIINALIFKQLIYMDLFEKPTASKPSAHRICGHFNSLKTTQFKQRMKGALLFC